MKARVIAFYLPQFHPVPENDEWWGKGFTEWTNVANAKPLFKGHRQPIIPGELGYYDLRSPEVRVQQAQLAQEYGIEGFCYYHYWLGNGKRLLEYPFSEVLKSGKPDFPFCLCWANHDWTTVWCGGNDVIARQLYPGTDDYINHFYALLPAFMDARWIKIDGKLLFFVFRPNEIPNPREFTDTWRDLARKENLPDFHFVGSGYSTWNSLQKDGFDSTVFWRHRIIEQIEKKKIYKLPINIYRRLQRKYRNKPAVFSYKKAMKYFLGNNGCKPYEYPCIIPNWDSTPRLGAEGVVLKDSTPELFRIHVKQTIKQISNRSFENRVVLLKSWNEWGEGNYIEPDSQFGRQYLEVLKDEITC